LIDGGRVHTRTGWREPRLARIEIEHADGRQETLPLTSLGSAEAFWTDLQGLLGNLRIEACPRVAFVSDGAPWILPRAKSLYPNALCILDFFHVCEHVHAAAEGLYGVASPRARAFAKRCRRLLRQGSIERLWTWLLQIRGPLTRYGPAARLALEKLLDYLEPRLAQMYYKRFRRRGFPIGSGRIEAMIRQVVNLRLKRTGATRWSVEQAEGMLALRAAQVTGRLTQVWQRFVQDRIQRLPKAFEDLAVSARAALEALMQKKVQGAAA
jgi:hypothetical protein